MGAVRKLHPFVDVFLHTDQSASEILNGYPSFDGPLFDAMRTIIDAIQGKASFPNAIAKCQSVHPATEDPFLVVCFLCAWAMASRKEGRLAEVGALLHRARALMTSDVPPELEAEVLHAESQLAMALGDRRRMDENYRRAQRIVPADSPRSYSFLLEYSLALSTLWRLPEVDEALETASRLAPARCASRVALSRFFYYAETGQVEKALPMLGIVERSEAIRRLNATILGLTKVLLEIMRNGLQPADAELDPVQPIALLLARRPEEALARVREKLTTYLDQYLAASTLPSFNLVRAELACGHGPAARRIMEIRRRRGNVHPLDEFFLARAELLCGNRELAAALFAKAMRVIEKHSAQRRLEFELTMSCELSPVYLLELGRQMAGQGPAKKTPASSPAAPEPAPLHGSERLIGRSDAICNVRTAVGRFAPLDVPVLITGETGTGKELVARAIHESGPRSAEPFLAVNCGAIAESLLESELFGHEKGAFTGAERARRGLFEEAGDGTIFLDEIAEITPRLQAAMLRVLETGEIRPVGSSRNRKVGCRVLAATNAALDSLVESGRFRKDLYYRLRRLQLHLPPLRERGDDILILANEFLSADRPEGMRAVLSEPLKSALLQHAWPGNVRELRNAIEHMRILNSDGLSYDERLLDAEVLGRLQPAPAPGDLPKIEEAPSGVPGGKPDAGRTEAAASEDSERVAQLLRGGRTSLRRCERLRELFRTHRTLTREEVMRITGISHGTATRDLKALRAEGCIEKVEPTRSPRTHYFRLRARPE